MAKIPQEIRPEEVVHGWEIQADDGPKRTAVWYVAATIIAGGLLILAITTSNFLFAIMILLVSFIIIIQRATPQKNVAVYFLNNGLVVADSYYPWGSFKSFYILYEPNQIHKIYFEFKTFRPDMFVEFGQENPLELRELLLQVLPENINKEEESLTEILQRILKI